MDRIAGLLEKFAALVGVQVERLWPQMVRVFWIKNVAALVTQPVMIVVMGALAWHYGQKAYPLLDTNNVNGWFFVMVASVLLGFSAFGMMIFYLDSIGDRLASLVYPEATYVDDLLARRTGDD